MKIDRTVILEQEDIFQVIKKYLVEKLEIQPSDVCSFQLQPGHPDNEPRRDVIRVILRQEVK